MRNDPQMAYQLGRTFLHTVDGFRPLPDGGEEALCVGAACALSRSAHISAPTPPDPAGTLPESRYALALYTAPGLSFCIGDRLEISDGERVYHATASDSFRYPSHCVTVVG